MPKTNRNPLSWAVSVGLILLLGIFPQGWTKDDGLAQTPPMGWNSWNAFQADIDEAKIKAIADVMVSSGMRDAGYVYLVLDDGWMAKERDAAGGALSIKGVNYPKGLGVRTGSRIMYKLGGKANRFQAVVGADDSYTGAETVRFRVLNEDFFGNQVLFDSGQLAREQAGVKIDIDVKGVEYLLLMVEGKGVAGNWAEAKVIANGRQTR